MAGNFTYLSVVSTVATNAGFGTHGYVQFLNLDWIPFIVTTGSGTSTGTVTTTVMAPVSVNGSTGAISIVGGPNITVSNSRSYIEISAADQTSPARADMWNLLGVAVSAGSPANPVQYSEWVNGAYGNWAWIKI